MRLGSWCLGLGLGLDLDLCSLVVVVAWFQLPVVIGEASKLADASSAAACPAPGPGLCCRGISIKLAGGAGGASSCSWRRSWYFVRAQRYARNMMSGGI